ncbi:MAG: trypsin-like peptidase domain-containing protein [Bdellovibrionaceae bacterium]|nr:trypsin-like peptidase domain-containing protein [Pseudobdellovibrionaceae bacterium]
MSKLALLFAVTILSACHSPKPADTFNISDESAGVIYGKDSRLDLNSVNSKAIENLSRISVALIDKSKLRASADGMIEITGKTLQQSAKFCPSEPFIQQRAPAFCSGILFRGKYVLTAGHCMSEPTSCADTAFVFGFQIPNGSTNWNYKVPARNVFSCRRIVAHQFLDGSRPMGALSTHVRNDFSVVELDRQVANQGAIAVTETPPKLLDPVMVLGYPSGLPLKYANGVVLESIPNAVYFRTNLDTYGGNSGSPVFNATGALEGILIQGHQDYARTSTGCLASVKCINGGNFCMGERVLKAHLIQKFLKINSF